MWETTKRFLVGLHENYLLLYVFYKQLPYSINTMYTPFHLQTRPRVSWTGFHHTRTRWGTCRSCSSTTRCWRRPSPSPWPSSSACVTRGSSRGTDTATTRTASTTGTDQDVVWFTSLIVFLCFKVAMATVRIDEHHVCGLLNTGLHVLSLFTL